MALYNSNAFLYLETTSAALSRGIAHLILAWFIPTFVFKCTIPRFVTLYIRYTRKKIFHLQESARKCFPKSM